MKPCLMICGNPYHAEYPHETAILMSQSKQLMVIPRSQSLHPALLKVLSTLADVPTLRPARVRVLSPKSLKSETTILVDMFWISIYVETLHHI